MKKHLIIRIALLLIGFLLIYIYSNWDSWFNPRPSIGGNDGMSIPMNLVLNLGWIVSWCFLLFIEMLVIFFQPKRDNKTAIANIILLSSGIILLIIYVSTIK